MKDVAIVIPALDEADALPAVLAAIPRERVSEIVVVDNGSRDATVAVALAAGATVVHEPRRGYGAACLRGIDHLRARPPAIVLFMDADGSADAAEMTRLIEPIDRDRAELVIGSRVIGPQEAGALTPVQRFGNALAVRLIRLLFGVRFTDLGPFRAIAWPALERLAMSDRDYGWTVEMQARAARLGLAAIEVPVSSRRRRGGRSKIAGTLRGAWGAGRKILLTIARVRLGG
jgi:glycosyltransferase involved in cell wall biosynthesis